MPLETFPQRKQEIARRLYRFLPMLLIMGLIFVASQVPDKTQPRFIDQFRLDKYLHVAAYAILALSTLYALRPCEEHVPFRWLGFIIFLFCGIYGISDELHQSFVPGRMMSIGDLAADLTGAFLAICGWRWIEKKVAANRQDRMNNHADPL